MGAFSMANLKDDWYLYHKGKAFINFMWSINNGFSEYEKNELSSISTQSIIEYTHLLLDKIHLHVNYKLEFKLEFPMGYYLVNKTNPQICIEDLLPHLIAETTSEFIWQTYLLTNASKILRDVNDIVVAYGDLLWMFSENYLSSFKWEPNINEFFEPKVFLEHNYARVECCWIEGNEWGLYKEICEYNIRESAIQLINCRHNLLLPPWGSDEYYECTLERVCPF